MVGVTSLGTGVAVAGVVNALSNLGGQLVEPRAARPRNRKDRGPTAGVRVRKGMHDIGDELGKIDWEAAGQNAEQMLTSTTMQVKPLAESVKEIAAAINSFNEGKPAEALRNLDGGSEPARAASRPDAG